MSNKTIPVRSKDNTKLAGSVSLGGRDNVPTTGRVKDALVNAALRAPGMGQSEMAKANAIALAYEAFNKLKDKDSMLEIERVFVPASGVSKLLKDNLKKKYLNTSFSVRSNGYSGGSRINISWTDGPTVKEVNDIVQEYAGATFDGSQDLKEYRPEVLTKLPKNFGVADTPLFVSFGADFIFADRDLSPAYKDALTLIAQDILDENQSSIGQAFECGFRDYPPLGSQYGDFRGGNGDSLLRWLSERISPETARAKTTR